MFNISGQNVNFVPGGPKNWHTFLYALSAYALTSSNIDIFKFISLSHPAVLTSNVPCVRSAAGRRTLKNVCYYRSRLVFICCF